MTGSLSSIKRTVALVGGGARTQSQRVKAKVTRATVRLILDRLPVIVTLLALLVVLGQGLNPQANEQHRRLHFIQAEGAVQPVLCVHSTELMEHGTPVRGLTEDGQEPHHCE